MLTGLFMMRAGHHAAHLRARGDEPIRPWMTVPYIARAYGVPPQVLFEAVGVSPDPRDRRPIGRIAAQQGRPVPAVIQEVRAAIVRYYSQQAPVPPTPPIPPTPPPPAPPMPPEGTP